MRRWRFCSGLKTGADQIASEFGNVDATRWMEHDVRPRPARTLHLNEEGFAASKAQLRTARAQTPIRDTKRRDQLRRIYTPKPDICDTLHYPIAAHTPRCTIFALFPSSSEQLKLSA